LRILIVSDTWKPQINGVVRTLVETARVLEQVGHSVFIVGPDARRVFTFTLPFYPEIKLEFLARARLDKILQETGPDFIHIATEGPLGWAARNLCVARHLSFTTSYHTRFPEYIVARLPHWLARSTSFCAYAILRRFHAPAYATMVATASIEQNLKAHKLDHLVHWSRGVDSGLFLPQGNRVPYFEKLPRPILLYVGRLAAEKNIRAFLDLQTQGSKVLIGDGPDRARLRQDYPKVHFLGPIEGEALADHYAAADLFVFPSKTDAFGLVLLEACAAGLRIAAYPVPGPQDILGGEICRAFAILDDDLQQAVDKALALPLAPQAARQFARSFSWQACTVQFYAHLLASAPAKKS